RRLPRRGARDGAAARARALPAARVSLAPTGPAGPRERRPVDRGGARDHPRDQAPRPRRAGRAGARCDRARHRPGRRLPAPPAPALTPDRPRDVPRAGAGGRALRLWRRLLHRDRQLPLHRPLPAAGARTLAPACGPVEHTHRGGLRRRLHRGAPARAAHRALAPRGRRLRDRRRRLPGPRHDRARPVAGLGRAVGGGFLARPVAGVHARHGPRGQQRPAACRRFRFGDLRDGRGARRRRRHRALRQPGRRGLPARARRHLAGRRRRHAGEPARDDRTCRLAGRARGRCRPRRRPGGIHERDALGRHRERGRLRRHCRRRGPIWRRTTSPATGIVIRWRTGADPPGAPGTTTETHAMDLAATQSIRDTIMSTPVEDLDPSDGYRFRDDTIHLVFERLRREDPVHWSTKTRFGSFWSVTRYKDIMAVDANHRVVSSDAFAGGSVSLMPRQPEEILPSVIEMDPPRHDHPRQAVSPIVGPQYLAKFEGLIRSRVIEVVESLPVGEPFDWVQRVSIDLTTKMLATLFDFPFEERHLLTWWSDIATGHPKDAGPVESWEMRQEELAKCLACFTGLWNERVNEPPRPDLISMHAHSPATRNMDEKEFLGNLLLLIVGGNDTTRNSMSGGLLALNRFPGKYDKLRARPELIPSMV